MSEPFDITSPGSAFAWQAQVEERLMVAMTDALTDFLAAVKRAALSSDLRPQTVEDLWTSSVTAALSGADWLSDEAYDYLINPLLNSDLPAEVYDSVTEVTTTAAREEWSDATLASRLEAILDPDTAEVIQAASERPKRLWDRARTVGTSWKNRMGRLVRTKVTGLQGHVTQRLIPDSGYKRWVTRRDEQVRPSHVAADRQTVPSQSTFTVGGASLMYPGQAGAQYEEIVNCRCVMISVKGP